ncbi:hypothetical protein I6F09_06085 [Bradyrhizobium sp. IC3195]|uniref:hypothetical protein n=1 Tax=Bradyrhizobium sp. IC3195 TaxID=2793804 RepID=UPI001CD44B3E|nr:hypothetical protein [Bradyrhizobium sp. IC3195]MCA1467452.1 hypothetical protein [Bradyrhizobium sp. IC3195]
MASEFLIFGSAAAGAALQEVLYWYEAYKSLDIEKYKVLMNSVQYWIIVVAFILVTGVVAVIWFQDDKDVPKLRDVLIFGVSLPLIVKQIIRSRPMDNLKLGPSDQTSVSYFDLK